MFFNFWITFRFITKTTKIWRPGYRAEGLWLSSSTDLTLNLGSFAIFEKLEITFNPFLISFFSSSSLAIIIIKWFSAYKYFTIVNNTVWLVKSKVMTCFCIILKWYPFLFILLCFKSILYYGSIFSQEGATSWLLTNQWSLVTYLRAQRETLGSLRSQKIFLIWPVIKCAYCQVLTSDEAKRKQWSQEISEGKSSLFFLTVLAIL